MRHVNRLLAAIVSIALAGAAVVLVIEVVAQRVGARPVVLDWHATYRWARRTTWDANAARALCVLIALVGLALLVPQLVPRGRDRVRVLDREPGMDAAITRRALAQAVASAADGVEGVRAARVDVRRRLMRIRARAAVATPGERREVRDSIIAAAYDRLVALRLRQRLRLSVHVSAEGR